MNEYSIVQKWGYSIHFKDMTYRLITYEEIDADYEALCLELQNV